MKYLLNFCFVLLVFTACNQNENSESKKKSISTNQVVSDNKKKKRENVINDDFENTFAPNQLKLNGETIDFKKDLEFKQFNNNTSTFYIGTNIASDKDLQLDENGVSRQNGEYHPTHIAKVALKAINHFKLTKSTRSLKIFNDQVRWALNNFHENEYYGFWSFSFDIPLYKLEKGWVSVFSQGLMLNVLLEAYKNDAKPIYLEKIQKALKAYLVPIENGGFYREWKKGEAWYEEYNTKNPSRVLNGTIYGLEGVYNVYQEFKIPLAKEILEACTKTLANHIKDYNAVYTSRYSLADWKNELSQEHYHEGHVIQLLWLYKITENSIFKDYAKKFFENDRYNFLTNTIYKTSSKLKSISASFCIDCEKFGTDNLVNDIWAYGNYWSSHKKADLTIEFDEKKEAFSGLTLYHASEQSTKVNFTLYQFNSEKNSWDYVQNFDVKNLKDNISGYNKTGKYETFIKHYKIFEPINSQKIKITFEANNKNIIALRNINFVYNRDKEFGNILKQVEKRFNKRY
ncbi:D-glucuronyl C5-epimerase family protein [Mesonia maritima]|uniref:D-glucuronyl C5-epimerase C-terminal domain-containing protein n=1 Tax=Mesonia maritima TaxID=1793873 RepID=A0ABU1K2H8_9FLAO|nr:D-glucuronyl C5-epimerase family protein [Mesonia maritima]MDR6299813.1 hypothetical protein [Mesonia maritima]